MLTATVTKENTAHKATNNESAENSLRSSEFLLPLSLLTVSSSVLHTPTLSQLQRDSCSNLKVTLTAGKGRDSLVSSLSTPILVSGCTCGTAG